MRYKCPPNVQSKIENELRWLQDLGMTPEEKITLLEFMATSYGLDPEDRDAMMEAAGVVAVEEILLK